MKSMSPAPLPVGNRDGSIETAIIIIVSGPGWPGQASCRPVRAWASQKPGFSARARAEQALHYSEEYYDGI